MELKKGQRLRVKEFDKRPVHWNCVGEMDKWMGKIVTLESFKNNNENITICEDKDKFWWRLSDFKIVFDTWGDVKNAIEKECDKHNNCYGCPLDYINTGLCFSSVFYAKDYKKLTENFKKMFGMECYVLEDEKMKKEFTLSDLKDEMVLVTRCKNRYVVIGNNFIGKDGFNSRYNYNQDMNCYGNCSEFDIVKVYNPSKKYYDGLSGLLELVGEPIWKETQKSATKDVSLEEINALLKEKYPDVEKFNLPIDSDK